MDSLLRIVWHDIKYRNEVWTVQFKKMSFGPKLSQSLNIIGFLKLGTRYGEWTMLETENMTYFLTIVNIILRILGLRKKDENDSFF